MAKLIAFEWDSHEARIAVANSRGNELVVEEAFAVELASPESGETLIGSEIGKQLAVVFAERGLSEADALVALSRSSIELRTLSLPVAPPEEIPDMVRFQAMQAFTTIGEDWPLDFVELEQHDDSINVLAAVVSPKEIEQVQKVCDKARVKAACLVLRPFAAVSLLQRSETFDAQRGSLIVDLLPEGADLTAVSVGQLVFMRSVRLPMQGDPQVQARALVGELRRTIAAAQNQMGSGQIEQIVICGTSEEHAVLHDIVSDALPQEVIAFDPFAMVRSSSRLSKNLPPHSGRYAPLLGMLACQLLGTRHTIDFLNPRKRPAPPSRKRRNVLIAATALAVVAALATVFLWQRNRLDRQIVQLQQESLNLDKAVDKATVLVEATNNIKTFTDGDVTWLDVVREIAGRLPDADHVILDEVTLAADVERGGRVKLMGHVTQPDVIAKLEQSLRYGENVVQGRMGVYDNKRKDYPYLLETTILVPPDKEQDGHSVGRPAVEETTNTGAASQKGAAATPAGKSDSKPPSATVTPDASHSDAEEKSATPEDAAPASEPADEAAESSTGEAKDEAAPPATPATTDSPASSTQAAPAQTQPPAQDRPSGPTVPVEAKTKELQETPQAGSQGS